jgi:hypothetical protein
LIAVGKITTREVRRWVPLLQWHRVSYVEAEGAPSPLFAAIDAEDATRIRAAIVSFLAAR